MPNLVRALLIALLAACSAHAPHHLGTVSVPVGVLSARINGTEVQLERPTDEALTYAVDALGLANQSVPVHLDSKGAMVVMVVVHSGMPDGVAGLAVDTKGCGRVFLVDIKSPMMTTTHELGHVFGLPHGTGVMLPSVNTHTHMDSNQRAKAMREVRWLVRNCNGMERK